MQVLSQVLVPPLAEEYSTVKKAWMEQKLWKDKDHVFIEILNDDCTDKQKAAFIAAIEQYLELCVFLPLPCCCHVTASQCAHEAVP